MFVKLGALDPEAPTYLNVLKILTRPYSPPLAGFHDLSRARFLGSHRQVGSEGGQ